MKTAFKLFPYRDESQPNTRWKVEGRGADGKRVRRFFTTKVEGEMFRDRLNTESVNTGFLGLGLTDAQRVEAAQCFAAVEARGKTLTAAVKFYLEHLAEEERSVTVKCAIDEIMAAKEAAGLSARHIINMRYHFKPLLESFSERIVSSLTRREIEAWMTARKLHPVSFKSARTHLAMLFNHCVKTGTASANPMKDIAPPRAKVKPPGILTPAAMQALVNLAVEHHPDILAAMLIQGFAGLRTEEVRRLDWREVNLKRGHIEVTAENSKTAQRRLVAIMPNLAKFLKPLHAGDGPVVPKCYHICAASLRARVKAAGHKFPDNALRHSFASYHLAAGQDAAKTSLQLGHKGAGMLFEHYRELVTPDDAAKWWGIGDPSPNGEAVPAAR